MTTGPDIRSHLPTLRRYALVLTRDPDEAEDLLQEALLRAVAGAGTWQPEREALPWLLAILHNAHVSRQRHRLAETNAARQASLLASATLPPPQLEQIHFNQTVTALMELPEEQRQVLVLVAIKGLSYRQAADILAVPIGTLMSRLARAREALRTAVDRREAPPATRRGLRLVDRES